MRHGQKTLNDAVRFFDAATGRNFQPIKYGEDTFGQHEAARNVLGDENWQALISGQVSVERIGNTLQLRDKSKVNTLFNRHGFRIVPRDLKAETMKPNPDYSLTRLSSFSIFSYEERLARIVKYLGGEEFITAQDFANRSTTILKFIEGFEPMAKLLKGVALPFVLPQIDVNDYGQVLHEKFLPAVEASYIEAFPDRLFMYNRQDVLAKKVTIAKDSRHEKLVEAMNQGVVVGVYFPNCLQGFSVDACREQMSSLPQQVLLAGGFEVASAMIAYPDVLARDNHTPQLDLAALGGQSATFSFRFSAHGTLSYLEFSSDAFLGDASDICSGGLVVLG